MQPRTPGYLWDICNAAVYIQAKIESSSFEQFTNDVDTLTIVERQIEIIGEAGRRLFAHDPETAERIPGLRGAIDMRNVIAHDYDDLDYEDIWRAITGPLLILYATAAELLAKAE